MYVSQAAQRRTWFTQYRTSDVVKNLGKYLSCTERTAQGNNFELILSVKIKTRNKGLFGSEFLATCNYCVVMTVWSRKTLKYWGIFAFFKTTPYVEIFKLMFRMFSSRHLSTLLCSNFVKFVRRKIGEIVRYLPDKKDKISAAANCCYCSDRAQNLPGPAPNNVFTVLQISSKSVYFRQSYSRTREHRQIAP